MKNETNESIIQHNNYSEIKEGYYKDKTGITEIIIPNSVSKMGTSAFENCSDLKSINIPKGLTSIAIKGFANCSSLENIELPENITSIGSYAFLNCNNLESILIPDTVNFIGDGAFKGCTNLKNIVLPKNLTSINYDSFSSCSSLESIEIPENVKYIRDSAFEGCLSLTNIIIPNSVSILGENSFSSCTSLNSITIPDSVKTVRNSAFSNCKNLKEIKLSNSMEEIPDEMFNNCSALETIDIPENIKGIGVSAFENCSNLKEFIAPNNLSSVGNKAFYSCSSLSKVNLNDNLTKIGDSAFNNCGNLEEITFPKQLNRISTRAFESCSNLKQINFGDNVTIIEPAAFNCCTSLENVEIPDSVFTLGQNAFSYCKKLKSVKLSESLTKLERAMFSGCLSLEEINIPRQVKSIEEIAFSSCKNLKIVNLPESLLEIQSKAFEETNIEEIVIPNSVSKIKDYAFSHCRNLKNIKLPDSLESVDPYTFEDCNSLTKAVIPENVKTIDSFAFSNCEALEEITLPNSILEIKDDAFFNCSSLKELHIPNSIKILGNINSIQPLYFKKDDDGLTLSTNQISGSIPVSTIKINLPLLNSHWEDKDTLFKEQRSDIITDFYNNFIDSDEFSKEQAAFFIKNHNFTFFKQLNLDNSKNNLNLYKLLYNLGGLECPFEDNGRKIDYAQKVIGFLQEKIKKNENLINTLNNIDFSKMKNNGFSKEFTDFFLSNFDEILIEQQNNPEFIARSYNEFDTIQKTNTNNRGSQRQLKPTVRKFIEYFDENKFQGVTPETEHIAKVISPYFSEQELFDYAVQINNERIKNNVRDNILSVKLKEKDVFNQIDEYTQKINNEHTSLLGTLTSIAKKEFTYEWLEKNDPQNFILGKLCSCCSHLDGAGYGIMRASMVDPNVQTLVIRNKDGDIIAKSTLFINPEERYGVFNNVEINDDVESYQHEKIYSKYIQGIKKFARQYNREHPDKPLMQINVGMHLNDLETQILTQNTPSPSIFKTIDYGKKYGRNNYTHTGDSSTSQYIIWENDEPIFFK